MLPWIQAFIRKNGKREKEKQREEESRQRKHGDPPRENGASHGKAASTPPTHPSSTLPFRFLCSTESRAGFSLKYSIVYAGRLRTVYIPHDMGCVLYIKLHFLQMAAKNLGRSQVADVVYGDRVVQKSR